MDWILVGGNPAPGDPPGIRTIARHYDLVSRNAEDAEVALRGLRRDADGTVWKGAAADRFKEELDGDVLSNLTKVARSYELASSTLETYADTLERLQEEAAQDARAAVAARDDEDVATGRVQDRDRARVALKGTRAKQTTHLAMLRQRYNDPAYADPANAAALEQLNAAYRETQARIRQTDNQIVDVDRQVRSAEADRDDARSRLRRARDSVAQLRGQRDAAVEEAKQGIDEAASAGIKNKGWREKVGDWVKGAYKWITNLDNLQKVLDGLAVVLTVAAIICAATGVGGPAAAILYGAARVATGLSMAISFVRVLQGKKSWAAFGIEMGVSLLAGRAGKGLFRGAAKAGRRLLPGLGLSASKVLAKPGRFGFSKVIAGHAGRLLPASVRDDLIRQGRTALRKGSFPYAFPSGRISDIARRTWPSMPFRPVLTQRAREWAARTAIDTAGDQVGERVLEPLLTSTVGDRLVDRFGGSQERQGSLPWTRECGP